MTQHYYMPGDMEDHEAGTGYSTATGSWVDGAKIIFGEIRIPAGTRAEPHTHPNEQFIYVLAGQCRMVIEDDERTVGKGDLIHIPAEAIHSADVVGDEDWVFVTAKDTSWGIVGKKVED